MSGFLKGYQTRTSLNRPNVILADFGYYVLIFCHTRNVDKVLDRSRDRRAKPVPPV
jgi:hypothetical protein